MSAPYVEKEPGPQGEKEPGPQGETTVAETPPAAVPEEKRKREYKDFGHEQEKATRTCKKFLTRSGCFYLAIRTFQTPMLICRRYAFALFSTKFIYRN